MARCSRILPALLGLLLAMPAPTGCQRSVEQENREEKAANAKKVTADSTDDATEPIVDEDYRFRLSLPGEGWKLLREHDASRLNADAIAGAMNAGGPAYGIVICERLPGTTLEQAKAMVWTEDLPDYKIESESDLDFQGVAAKRRAFTATIEGQHFQFLSTIFIRQDHFYQLMSWTSDLRGSGKVVALLPFHDAFELLDGEVRGRDSAHAPIVDADGVGWRIREGRYESALSELRVRPSEGWRFVIGNELELLGSDAEIVFLHEVRNAYFALVVDRVSQDRRESLAQTARGSFEAERRAPATETFQREVAGRKIEFRRYDESPLGYVHGVFIADEAITQLMMWYPLGLAGEAMIAFDELLVGIEQLPTDERAQLRQALLGSAGSQRQFGKDRAHRAREFLDYEHRLRWRQPPGFWQIDSFAKSTTRHSKDAVLTARELDLGIHVAIEAFPSDADPNDILTNLIDDDELLSRDTDVVDGLSIYRAKTIDKQRSPAMSYEFATTRRGDLIIAISAWTAGDSPTHRQVMEAAVAGLEYDIDPERTKIVDGVYHDVKHGFSFAIPAGFDSPVIKDLGLAQVVTWTSGSHELVSLLVTGAAVTDDEEWITSYFEQILRDRVSIELPVGKPTRSEVQLGGHTARHLSWKQDRNSVSADILVDGSTIHCLIYGNLSDRQIEVVQSSWSLLE